jgi:hypothetical protein
MNKDEWTSLVTVMVAMVGPVLAQYGVTSSDLSSALMGLFAVAMCAWTLWHNWDLRKVKETAVVTGTAADVTTAKALSTPAGK